MMRKCAALLLCCLAVAIFRGCAKNGANDGSASEPGAERPAASLASYPGELSAESSPSDVAMVLIEALDGDDKETLLGLVAVNHEMEAVDAIYRRHGRASDISPEKTAAMTATGWQATYAFFKNDETTVERETVRGDTAEVFASGKSPVGEPRTLKIKLVREDDVWKVRAGLLTLAE